MQEAVRLLAIAAVYDNRTPSQAAAQAWAADLADVPLTDAAAAVREHYTTQPDVWLKAGHVLAIVKRNRRRRLDRSWLAEAGALRGGDPDDVAAFLAELREARHGVAVAEPNGRLALPAGKYDDSASQTAVNARGKAAAMAAIRPSKPREPAEERDAWAELCEITDVPPELIAEPEPPATTG